MPRKRRRTQTHCSWLAKKVAEAFAAGDTKRGRELYHRAAAQGCRAVVTMDGLKRKRRRVRPRRRKNLGCGCGG